MEQINNFTANLDKKPNQSLKWLSMVTQTGRNVPSDWDKKGNLNRMVSQGRENTGSWLTL